jgi:hypothetical protein
MSQVFTKNQIIDGLLRKDNKTQQSKYYGEDPDTLRHVIESIFDVRAFFCITDTDGYTEAFVANIPKVVMPYARGSSNNLDINITTGKTTVRAAGQYLTAFICSCSPSVNAVTLDMHPYINNVKNACGAEQYFVSSLQRENFMGFSIFPLNKNDVVDLRITSDKNTTLTFRHVNFGFIKIG